jgi:glycosyltransferase involved in cell wall biosynthesis
MLVTALVPTYRRPEDLRRCLDGFKAQTRLPDEMLVVVRDTDEITAAMLDAYDAGPLRIRRVLVHPPGQVAALNRGLEEMRGDIVAITDDDAVPRPEWIQRVAAHFESDDTVGGVGGPDWTHQDGQVFDGSAGVCGRVQWFGRIDAADPIRKQVCDTDILKGANMSYRRAAIGSRVRFDTRLAGAGAQLFNDFAFALAIRREGWRNVFDREVTVDHYPGQRLDKDKRNTFKFDTLADALHNLTFIILTHLAWHGRPAFMTYALLLGSNSMPGLVWLPMHVLRGAPNAVAVWGATAVGRARGLRTFLAGRPNEVPVQASPQRPASSPSTERQESVS